MRARASLRRLRSRHLNLSLTQQVALLSLLPIVALGFALTRVLENQIVSRTLADASESAGLIARIGIQPNITPRGLRDGLSAAETQALDRQLSERSVTTDLARIKIWNSHHEVVYSDDHALIGRTLTPSDDLLHALAGRPDDAEVVTPSPYNETASEVGLGQLVEVYVPLRIVTSGPPVGRVRDLSELPADRSCDQPRQENDRPARDDRPRASVGGAVPDRRAGLAQARAPVARQLRARAL